MQMQPRQRSRPHVQRFAVQLTSATPCPLPHLRTPARRRDAADAHEPHRSTAHADGAAQPPQPSPSPGHRPADPGGRRDPDRLLTVNGVTSYANDHYRLLGGDELSDAEPTALLTPLAGLARSPAAHFPEPAWPASDHGSLASAARSPRSDQRTGKGADRCRQ